MVLNTWTFLKEELQSILRPQQKVLGQKLFHRSWALNLENIGLIKIDVEGFEIEVLKGARETLLKNKPAMIIENESVHTKDTNQLFMIMDDLGYEKYICNSRGELEKIDNFSVEDNQKGVKNLNINYIQNYIFIFKEL